MLNRAKLIYLLLAILCAGCSPDLEYNQNTAMEWTAEDFYGCWYTDLPNGERWELTLEPDGRFQAKPIRNSYRSPNSGSWKVENGAFHWRYDHGKTAGETNPIILKNTNKFMLQERMGMQSIYYRENS